MRTRRSEYDVVVIGAGPAGSVAAIAFAQKGASVALLEADPRGARRFAGEWLHPTGVAVLDRLRVGRLESARPRTGYGFVIFPDDGSPAIEMPYSNGVALSAEHSEIVESVRDCARHTAGIEYVPFTRAVEITAFERGARGARVRCEDRESGAAFELRAGRVIGADGRSSIVRSALGYAEQSSLLSYMASVELRGAELPREGFGHVVLGGPGPALFYRISDDSIRGCLDLPISVGAGARTPAFLWDAFHPVLPASLREPFRAALERGPVGWAANRFRPRGGFGRGPLALIGDALGHVHPMTAIGITMGVLDAEALAAAPDLAGYERDRRGYIPELLSNALYHCFRRDDPSATEVRRAMFSTLRASESERRRTMEILACADLRKSSFGSVFLKIAAQAIGSTVSETAREGRWLQLGSALAQYGEWMQWPAALTIPEAIHRRYRGASTTTHPIPALAPLVATASPLDPPESEERHDAPQVPVSEAIEKASEVLLRELEAIARSLGTVPDAAIAGPALRMMRAITSSAMRPAMAARMTLGRRRLAVEGVPRLFHTEAAQPRSSESPAWTTAHLAELLLVLLDGAPWGDEPIVQLAEAVRALIECQTEHGGFAAGPRHAALPRDHEGDLESTVLAVRALWVVLDRSPDASDANIAQALERAARWLRARQSEDGSWPAIARASGGGAPPMIQRTALALEALVTTGAHTGEPAVRRALRWLTAAVRAELRADPEQGDPRDDHRNCDVRSVALALRALCAAGQFSHPVVAEAARALAGSGEVGWELAAETVLALAAYEARRVARPVIARGKGASGIDPDDWKHCRRALGEVSRTFSRPIAMLPERLEIAVTLGYLLCRVADTIEDHPAVPAAARDRLFSLFLDVLEHGRDAREFERELVAIEGDDAELALSRSLSVVMRVFARQSEATRETCIRWVGEMARGMNLYGHRRPGDDGFVALETIEDLERYCYFVAGTVGHLLTDLFVREIGAGPELELALREDAESFATALQLVNILKDVTDDRERRWSFVPRTAAARAQTSIASLCEREHRARAHSAVEPLFDLASRRLEAALRYALAIPPSHTGIRLFCLLPLMMAAQTMVHARGNDAMFVAGEPVKISRDEVESIIADCAANVGDDAAIRARYARIWAPLPMPGPGSSRRLAN